MVTGMVPTYKRLLGRYNILYLKAFLSNNRELQLPPEIHFEATWSPITLLSANYHRTNRLTRSASLPVSSASKLSAPFNLLDCTVDTSSLSNPMDDFLISPYDNAQGYCNSLRRLHGTQSVIVTGNRSDVSDNTNEPELLGSVTNPEPTSSTREIASQSQSPLFNLPGELRLMVYSYFSLSPLSAEFPDSRGAYFTCRRLQSELRAELRTEKVINEIKGMVSDCSNRCSPGDIAIVLPPTRREYVPSFSLLQVVRLYISSDYLIFHLMQEPGECNVLSRLYGYYLENLHIVVSKRRSINWEFFPWDDMKSMDHKLMAPFVALGRVNCSKITFTLEHMIEADTDEGKTTTIENIFPGTDISYQLTIVEDGNGNQLQRSYASSTRFKTLTELES
jgi:hypothetical protein